VFKNSFVPFLKRVLRASDFYSANTPFRFRVFTPAGCNQLGHDQERGEIIRV
jgi:hypothetical protein